MVSTSRDNSSTPGGRFLPAVVVIAALVAIAGLMSVRADGAADAYIQGGLASVQ